MAERTYSDFDLLIDGSEDEGYRARVVDSPTGEATVSFDFPFSELELENFMLKVGRPRRGTRRLESPEMEAARAFGSRLFNAVFHGDLELVLRRSLDEVERRNEGLRIRLRFSGTPELASLPWEFLFSETDDEFLVLSAWTPIVRYLDLTQSIEPLAVTAPLRILAMISSPHDYPGLNVEEEWRRIEVALRPLVETGSVVIERTEEATLLALQRKLRRSEYHIFHFLGHGGFDEKSDDGVLVLEDGTGKSRLVAGRDLGTILDDHRSLRLAVLNACEGARAASTDPFSGAAQSLVRKGIPAVVAMQFEITDDAAIVFAQEFYRAIADGLPVDAALGEARRAIFGQGNDIEWGTPVVYLRGDGRLFDVLAAPPPQADSEVEKPGDRAAAAAGAAALVEQPEPEKVASMQQGPAGGAATDVSAASGAGSAQVEVGAPLVPRGPVWRRRSALIAGGGAAVVAASLAVAIFAVFGTRSADSTQPPATTQATTTTQAETITPPFELPDVDLIYNQPVPGAVNLLRAAGLIVSEDFVGCSTSSEVGDVRQVTVGSLVNVRIIYGKPTEAINDAAIADVGPGDEITVWTPRAHPCP